MPSDHRPKGVQRPVCPPMKRHGFWRRRATSPAAGLSRAPPLVTNGSFPQTPGSLHKKASSSLTKGKPVFTAGSGEVRGSGAGLPSADFSSARPRPSWAPAGHVSRTWPPYCASLILVCSYLYSELLESQNYILLISKSPARHREPTTWRP